ncbi:hypothetical protein ACHAXR_007756 [Thalassiosira sp. AJA248-18]
MASIGETPAAVVIQYDWTVEVPIDATKVVFDSTVTEIEEEVFRGCRNLREVVLNEGLRKIGIRSFWNCRSLRIIKLPSTVTVVGHAAFWDCIDLRDLVLNEGLRKIGEGAFRGCRHMEIIRLPSTVTEIGNRAFSDCTDLRDLVLNERLRKIGEESFQGCRHLRGVALNEGLQKIGNWAFRGCTSLEVIRLPSTITEVGGRAFWGCTNLRDVGLNKGVQKIGEDAFRGCSSLENINISYISSRLEALGHIDQTAIANKINEASRVEWRGGEILISLEAVTGENWEATRESLHGIVSLITYCELKEAATIFELALWKANIGNDFSWRPAIKKPKIDEESAGIDYRDEHRVAVPDPVKAAVLQFFSYN